MTERQLTALGLRLRRVREERGMARERLARACRLSVSTIKNVERGTHRPSATTLHLLCQELQLTPGELLAEADALGELVLDELRIELGTAAEALEELRRQERACRGLLGGSARTPLVILLAARLSADAKKIKDLEQRVRSLEGQK